jgi:hypothetical protein
VAGDVGDVVGPRGGRSAERAGSEVAAAVAVEGDSGMLEPEDLVRRLAAHDLDRVLVAEEVRALDGVVRVRLPGVLRVERGVDAARGGNRVGPHRVDLGDDGDGGTRLGGCKSGPLAGEAGPDDQDVM